MPQDGSGAEEVTVVKVLLVEDDVAMSDLVCDELSLHGFSVDQAVDGRCALEFLEIASYELLILDFLLPDIDGAEICSRYRRSGGVSPVLFLTGRTGIEHKILGYDSGADDYLTKPFDIRELLLRVKALLSRAGTKVVSNLEYASLKIDTQKREVHCGDRLLRLAPKEFDMLLHLIRHQGRVFTAAELGRSVWSGFEIPSDENVRVCLSRLRKSLASCGLDEVIVNSHGHGYMLVETHE